MPPPPMEEGAGAPMAEDCIPLAALSMPDEQEQMQPPAEGDKVNYSVDGIVTRIDGENAYVRKTSVNGTKVEGAVPPPKDEMSELEGMAKNMPPEDY